MPIGVHFKNRPRHVSQPPAASNHQSNTDIIVQPAPAFHPHDFRIRFSLLNLPFLDVESVVVELFVLALPFALQFSVDCCFAE